MRFFKILIAASALCFAASLAFYMRTRPDSISVERVSYQGAEGGRIVADLYLPNGKHDKLPVVILCHGVEANKEVMGHIGVEFAKRGYAALAFDYGGYGESDRHDDRLEIMIGDTVAAIKFMLKRPETDGSSRVALVGHSMGVTYSVETATAVKFVRGVVGLGNEALAVSVPPNNVALAMGVYDAFHTLDDMMDVVRESSGVADQKPDQLVGDFSRGTARAMLTSPYSDHGIEPVDPMLISKTISWIDSSLGGAGGDPGKIVEPSRAKARLFMFLAGAIFIVAATVLIGKAGHTTNGFVVYRLYFMPIVIAAVVGNIGSPALSLVCVDVSIAALLGGSIAAALMRRGYWKADTDGALIEAKRSLIAGAAFTALALVCLLSGLLIGGIPQAAELGYLSKIPAFLATIVTLRPYEGLCMARAYGFRLYSDGWMPGIPLAIGMVVEFARPGAVTDAISYFSRVIVKAFRLTGPIKFQTSPTGAVGAVAAFVGLGAILYKRFREGWLSPEAIRKMFVISLKFMIIPLIIFIVAVNVSAFFRKMEP